MFRGRAGPLVWTTFFGGSATVPDVESGRTRPWRPGWACPVGSVLAPLRRGSGDPAYRTDETGAHWLAMRMASGPTTLRIESIPGLGEVRGEAWGPGADEALAALPELLGAEDVVADFKPHHPAVAEAWRRFGNHRIGRTSRILEALVPAALEQKVTGQEAYAGYRALVRRFGEPAPGPGADRGMRVLPDPATLRHIPSWEWLRMPVDPARSRVIVTAAQRAAALERLTAGSSYAADRALRSLPGIGEWTSAEVRLRAFGDADAASFGDYHLAKEVGWALFGHDLDDEGLREVLDPYRPHRARVGILLGLAGHRRPRRGPRLAPRGHLPATS